MSAKEWHFAETQEPVPSVGDDLMDFDTLFKELPDGRAQAVLELLRHGDLTTDQAAQFLNITKTQLKAILGQLPIDELNRLAKQTLEVRTV